MMGDSDGGSPSPIPTRVCIHCQNTFFPKSKVHRSCCNKARSNSLNASLSQRPSSTDNDSLFPSPASKGDKRKKDVQSPNTTDSTGQKRGRSDPSTLFLEETDTTTILDWPKDVLIAKLSLCMSHLLTQCNLVSDLESSNSILRCQLNDHVLQVGKLEADIVNIKLAFADSVLGASRFCNPSVSPNPSYAMVARGPATSSVLVAKCVAGSEPPVPVDLMAVKKMLDTLNTGLIPSHVRVKNDKMFITLDNELAVSKATDILNKQPEFRSQFSQASKLNFFFPVVALFVDVTDLDHLKFELEHRNKLMRGQIHSLKKVYSKPNSPLGHVKIFLQSREARDNILLQKKVSVNGVNFRVVPIDLDREVRRCFRCQKYGHIQGVCKAVTSACGKCSKSHRTSECSAAKDDWRCVNCDGPHQTGSPSFPEQIKAVARYRSFLDKYV